MERLEGKIKAVNSKGYGFIETKLGIDYFFHHTSFLNGEEKGDWKGLLALFVSGNPVEVTFDNDPMPPQGPRALNVRLK